MKVDQRPGPGSPYERLPLLPWSRYRELSELAGEVGTCDGCQEPLEGRRKRWCSRRCQDRVVNSEVNRRERRNELRRAKPWPKREDTPARKEYRAAYYQANKDKWQESKERSAAKKASETPEEREVRLAKHRARMAKCRIKKRKAELERRAAKREEGHRVPAYRPSTKPVNVEKRKKSAEMRQGPNARKCVDCGRIFAMVQEEQTSCTRCQRLTEVVGE